MARRALPLIPCLCFFLAGVVLVITLLGSKLPEDDNVSTAFVSSGLRGPPKSHLTQLSARKLTARDRGKPGYQEYFDSKKEARKAEWLANEPGGYDSKVGGGGGEYMQEMQFYKGPGDSPAPAPAPAPSAPPSLPFSFGSPSPAPAPAPARAQAPASGGDDGNPFQWLVDLIQGTTTTTTTTPPPSPLESFLSSIGFR
eukprot:TRINITY_DN3331_c1_g1_i1.p1 TRINITY_DN3331_c1_g1~~TRINITY_DN3331_c1_g1_i1.p1  ORF type:complete len:198 (-),score=32.12 TRINITY_DN3331_c1_g1_i1:112-705(-)